jgi:hypothetical protein
MKQKPLFVTVVRNILIISRKRVKVKGQLSPATIKLKVG